jgi:pilus assembly protein CpaE
MTAVGKKERPQAAGAAHPAAQAFSRVVAFLCDDVTHQTVARLASEMGWRQPVIERGGIHVAIENLAGGSSPDLLIVDLSDSADPLGDINALADVCEPDTRVIALGTVNDVKLYRGLVSAGIVDYLLKPANPADILRAVSEAAGVGPESRSKGDGKLCIVVGARGGVGASSIATSLAWLAAERHGSRTALLDLDLHFGVGALTFDAEPGNGLGEMLEDPDRIDTLFLDRASVGVTDRLALFAMEAPLSAPAQPRPESALTLVEELVGAYDWVIVDMPREMIAALPELLAIAEVVTIVTDLSLASMRDAMRLRAFAAENGPQAKLRLIANETRPQAKGELQPAEFEKTMGADFDAIVPLDRKAVGDAEGAGRPLAACSGKAPEAIGTFADGLFSAGEEAEKPVRKAGWSFPWPLKRDKDPAS